MVGLSWVGGQWGQMPDAPTPPGPPSYPRGSYSYLRKAAGRLPLRASKILLVHVLLLLLNQAIVLLC
jgi:hypothetical protein